MQGFQGFTDFFDTREGKPSFKRNAAEVLEYMKQGVLNITVEKKFPLEETH